MPTTSNFGWTTPADTDLVKDGALAIRTLGNGVDSSLVDLKGGTTGQILSKASNTDLDYTWITASTGFVGVKCTASASQTITSATTTVLTWDGEEFDTDGFHSTVTNTGRITIPAGKAGYYRIFGYVGGDNNATGSRYLMIYKNGVSAAESLLTPSTAYPTNTISTILNLAVSDYVDLRYSQTSGSNQQAYTNGVYGTFQAQYLGA